MYISIDMDALQIICKNPDWSKCWNYSLICKGDSFNIFDIEDFRVWGQFTDLEIQTLYINLTNNLNGCIKDRDMIHLILIQYLMQADETIINNDVEAQAAHCIESDTCGKKQYVLGADRAIDQSQTIWINYIFNKTIEDSAPDKTAYRQAVQAPYSVPGQRNSNENSTVTRERVPRTRAVPANSKPTGNNVCARIWELADKLWASDPNPATIKKLKKDAKIELVSQGINPSTISVQLGKWEKARINVDL